MYWGTTIGQVLLLAPLVVSRGGELANELKTQFWRILAVAILCPLSYVLVLTAMVFTPVSYVAPAREVSILIGTAMGTRFLAEENAKARLAAAAFIVLGVAGLAAG